MGCVNNPFFFALWVVKKYLSKEDISHVFKFP